MILTIRRWRADDDEPDTPGTMSGSLNDLTMYDDPPDDGLVGPDGRPIERPAPVRKRMGFLPPSECRE